ncbi:hypothetical protein RJ640_022131 [Escallonia rubra]|uniref:Uncharacterized protein n=1 Tax=Escallonia rubra TaxID=112253 RepID=A0AA88RPN6_9ASTE|nr:hypothetical protein RJ640_022131 [Escallonia rubra]
MDVLTLDIKTQRYNMRPQTQNLVLIYRIYYKAMTTICPAFKQIADPGKFVILFRSNPYKANVMLPRRFKFNELTPPEDWVIENKAAHHQVNPQKTKIDHTIETHEGDVKIRTFNHPNLITASEIQSIAEQSNYSNIILSTIGEQTTRIEDIVYRVKDIVSDFYSKMQPSKGINENVFNTSSGFNFASTGYSIPEKIEQPLVKPFIKLDNKFKLGPSESSNEFLMELMSKLGQIKTLREKYPKVEFSQSSPKNIRTIGEVDYSIAGSEVDSDDLE